MSDTSIGAANGAGNHSNFAAKGNGVAGPHTTADLTRQEIRPWLRDKKNIPHLIKLGIGSKIPVDLGWQDKQYDFEDILLAAEAGHGIGLRLDSHVMIDVEPTPLAEDLFDVVISTLEKNGIKDPPIRTRPGSNSVAIVLRAEKGLTGGKFMRGASVAGSKNYLLEFISGHGKQAHIFGARSDEGNSRLAWTHVPAFDDRPILTADCLNALVAAVEAFLGDKHADCPYRPSGQSGDKSDAPDVGSRVVLSEELFRAAVAAIPNDEYFANRETWINFMHGLIGASRKAPWARDIWLDWCNSIDAQTPGAPETAWDTCRLENCRAGVGTIKFHLERLNEFALLDRVALEEIDAALDDDFEPQGSSATPTRLPNADDGPTPLRVETRVETKFPLSALGPVLSAAVHGSAAACQVPVSLCATSSLTIMSLLAQGHYDVEHPAARYRVPISLHAMTVGESGMRKSTVDRLLSIPLQEHQTAAEAQYRRDLREYEFALKAHKGALNAISNDRKRNYTRDQRVQDMRALGPGPTAPIDPSIITTAPTIEGLLRCFRDGMPSQGLFSSEGGDFVGGYAFRPENRLGTFSMLSKFWDGGTIRKSLGDASASIYIEGRRLTMHLLAPDVVIATILSDPVAQAQGVLGRILLTRPDSISGTREFRIAPEEEIAMCAAFHDRARDMLACRPCIDVATGGVDPSVLNLDAEAVEVFRQFYNHVEKRLGPKGAYISVKPFAEKVAEQSLRIAGVLTGVVDLNAKEIGKETMISAVELARYYLQENLRIREASDAIRDASDGETLVEWLKKHKKVGAQFSTREVQHEGPNTLRNGARLNGALDTLVAHGWIRRSATRQRNSRGRVLEQWDILALDVV